MQPQQHNQPRGGFAPGGNKNGTSPTFVRMASALISYYYASAILESLAICVTVVINLLLHAAIIIIAYISVATSIFIIKEVSLVLYQ